jgi:hypothetical protein
MGDGLIGPNATAANAIVASLNKMFENPTLVTTTVPNINALRQLYPSMLSTANPNDHDRTKRQRGLRFAGWLMTSDIEFSPPGLQNAYPATEFKTWLKWLNWVDRFPNKFTVFVGKDAQGNWIPSNEQAADAIITTINLAIAGPSTIGFEWNDNSAGGATMIQILRGPFQIKVFSPDANSAMDNQGHKVDDEGETFKDH